MPPAPMAVMISYEPIRAPGVSDTMGQRIQYAALPRGMDDGAFPLGFPCAVTLGRRGAGGTNGWRADRGCAALWRRCPRRGSHRNRGVPRGSDLLPAHRGPE